MRRLLTIGPDATAPRSNPARRLLTIGPDATAPEPRANPGLPEGWIANPTRRGVSSLEGWIA